MRFQAKKKKKNPSYSGKCWLLQVGVKAPGTPKMTTFLPLNELRSKFWGIPQAWANEGSYGLQTGGARVLESRVWSVLSFIHLFSYTCTWIQRVAEREVFGSYQYLRVTEGRVSPTLI